MTTICQSPFGFEDGEVVNYRVASERLEMTYEFWNEKRATITFERFVAVRDIGSIGVTVGRVLQLNSSKLLSELVARHYDAPPEEVPWTHFQFLDVQDEPMLEIVASDCTVVPRDAVPAG
jgi:hypothetical protein